MGNSAPGGKGPPLLDPVEAARAAARAALLKNRDVTFEQRYTAVRLLGRGSYAKVVECVRVDGTAGAAADGRGGGGGGGNSSDKSGIRTGSSGGGGGAGSSGSGGGAVAAAERFAAKVVEKGTVKREDVEREIAITLLLADHPATLRLHDVFDGPQEWVLVTELCGGGQLFERLEQKGRFPERQAALVLRSLLRFLSYAHDEAGVVHRDVKLENLLLSDAAEERAMLKVIDLGCSAFLPPASPPDPCDPDPHSVSHGPSSVSALPASATPNPSSATASPPSASSVGPVSATSSVAPAVGPAPAPTPDPAFASGEAQPPPPPQQQQQQPRPQPQSAKQQPGRLTQVLGSPHYIAPEMLAGGGYAHGVDVWAAGVVAFALLSGSMPFRGEGDLEVLRRVRTGAYSMDDEGWWGVSATAREVVGAMLQPDPNHRPTARQLLQHDWFYGSTAAAVASHSSSEDGDGRGSAAAAAAAVAGAAAADPANLVNPRITDDNVAAGAADGEAADPVESAAPSSPSSSPSAAAAAGVSASAATANPTNAGGTAAVNAEADGAAVSGSSRSRAAQDATGAATYRHDGAAPSSQDQRRHAPEVVDGGDG